METAEFVPQDVRTFIAMEMANMRVIALVGCCCIVGSYLVYRTLYQRRAAPGPPRLPLLGNLLQLPSQLQFIQYTKWAEDYGSIFSLDVFNQHIIVVNSFKAANDLFDRRSYVYNDRPPLIMAGEILGGGMTLTLMKSGELWRRMRRAAHENFNPRAVERYRVIHTQSAIRAALRTIAKPDGWERNIQLIVVTSILSSVYGWPDIELESPFPQFFQALLDHVSSACLPGTYLVDTLPFLNYLPAWMAPWKREGLAWHDRHSQILEEFNAGVRKKMEMEDVDEQSSFVADLIAAQDRYAFHEEAMRWLPAVMISGGTDTVAVALTNCILALLHSPAILQKAHAELDAVIGRGRVPCYEDKEKLPYIQTMARETLRWRPPAPLALPHATTQDDWYEGYFIPKGTVVIGNTWAMNRDPSVYADPDVFQPERFLNVLGQLDVPVGVETHQMGHTSFGFGKRICPGMHFAVQELFIALAVTLWAFDIQPPVDEKGKAVLPPTNKWVDATIVVRPAPFGCKFSPRFPAVQDILEASVATT
ncbi:cytochrome P450 [Irpex lacteus]|nr:cytochrome P450 [Irpex lacteus]